MLKLVAVLFVVDESVWEWYLHEIFPTGERLSSPQSMLRLRHLLNILKQSVAHIRTNEDKGAHHTYKRRGKKRTASAFPGLTLIVNIQWDDIIATRMAVNLACMKPGNKAISVPCVNYFRSGSSSFPFHSWAFSTLKLLTQY